MELLICIVIFGFIACLSAKVLCMMLGLQVKSWVIAAVAIGIVLLKIYIGGLS